MVISPRNRELTILLSSLGIGSLGLYLVNETRFLPFSNIYPYLIFLVSIYFILHLVLRFVAPQSDHLLLSLVAFISSLGLVVIYRIRPQLFERQIIWMSIGIALASFVLIFWRRLRRIEEYRYTCAILGIALLLAPIFFGHEVGGAKLWLNLGRFSFQPAEPAKILIVIFLAGYLKEKRELLSFSTYKIKIFNFPEPKYLGPLLTMWLLSLLILVFEKDLGSSFLFLAIFLVMIYTATARFVYLGIGSTLFLLGATLCYYFFSHVQSRIDIWINPWIAISGKGYQIVQSLFALSSGGIFGTGLGLGYPQYVPAVHTDFVFAALGEELGHLGVLAILFVYLLVIYRGTKIALNSTNEFEKLLAFGLTAIFGLQSLTIIGGVTKLIPLTGITLPFMSYGGSSLVVNFVLLGLLLAISQNNIHRLGSAKRISSVNDSIRRIFLCLLFLFVLLWGNLFYLQVLKAKEISSHPRNTRHIARELAIERGLILSNDGTLLAKNKKEGRQFHRIYPQGKLFAHIVGFNSVTLGRAGIEKSFNTWLLGKSDVSLTDLFKIPEQKNIKGNDLILTIDSKIQKQAASSLGKRKGAVVVLDPKSGALLAMVSFPAYDPNGIESKWDSYRDSDESPLLNRSLQGLYPPGSTFKMVTLASALDLGLSNPDKLYPAPQELKVYGGKVTNYGKQNFPPLTLREGFYRSVNTLFAQVGLEVGGKQLVSYTEKFGFNKKIPLRLEYKKSQIPPVEAMDKLEIAWSSVGQGRVLATPLQMALVATAIANGGKIMSPYIVQKVISPQGKIIFKQNPKVWLTPINGETSQMVKQLMVNVVEQGTGRSASIPGVTVAGKTGTAEITKGRKTHAWFVGFAPAQKPKIAIAVIVEEGGTGGRVAAPIAREVLEQALK